MSTPDSYFSRNKPAQLVNSWLHPYKYSATVILNNKTLLIEWTQRAENELLKLESTIIIELQLYFACMVRKRVLFHTNADITHTTVNDTFSISFRAVQSNVCDLKKYPNKQTTQKELTSQAALKMHPTKLQFDYENNKWLGEYFL